jgi:hypothetical protein
MPALPPMPSMSWPKVTSSLANTDMLAVGLKKFTPPETSPHTSWIGPSGLDRVRAPTGNRRHAEAAKRRNGRSRQNADMAARANTKKCFCACSRSLGRNVPSGPFLEKNSLL